MHKELVKKQGVSRTKARPYNLSRGIPIDYRPAERPVEIGALHSRWEDLVDSPTDQIEAWRVVSAVRQRQPHVERSDSA